MRGRHSRCLAKRTTVKKRRPFSFPQRNVHRVPVPLQPSSLPPKPFTLIDHRCFTLKSTISSKSFLSDLGRNRLKQLFPLPSPPSAATITLCFSPNLPFYRRRSRKLYRCLKGCFFLLKYEKELHASCFIRATVKKDTSWPPR